MTYRVRMETVVEVERLPSCDMVRVWHATPTVRPWSMAAEPAGFFDLSARPRDGLLQFREQDESMHSYWVFNASAAEDGRFVCRSEYSVASCDRAFSPNRSKTAWEDYSAVETPAVDAASRAEVARIASKLRAGATPAEFVQRCCVWIDDRLTYDASVPHSSVDCAATLRASSGHCGHYFTVLRELCAAEGIPVKRVFGLNLAYDEPTETKLFRVRADYANIHTWAEVLLPKDGSIEVEPSAGKRAFRIPARFIQNNVWFQNYSVWLRESGQWRQPRWLPRNGGWDSELGVRNLIRFTKTELGKDPSPLAPREWQSDSGRHSVVAAMLGSSNTEVELATSDGRVIRTPLARLSGGDQRFVAEAREARLAAPAKAAPSPDAP